MIAIQIIGWIGAVLLATCGIPQLVKTIKTLDFSGLSIIFILWWFLGEVFLFTYIVYDVFRWPLIFNYAINLTVTTTILLLFLLTKTKKFKPLSYNQP